MEYTTRVTKLQAFNLFRSEDWFNSEKLIDQISGTHEVNKAMKLGTDFHKMIENRPLKKSIGIFSEEVIYEINAIEEDCAREVEGELIIPIEQGSLIVSGHADAIKGNMVIDYKTTLAEPHIDMYFDSYQWRLYLLMFDAKVFKYDFFKLSYNKAVKDQEIYTATRLDPLYLYAYKDMFKDCQRLAQDFVNVIEKVDPRLLY